MLCACTGASSQRDLLHPSFAVLPSVSAPQLSEHADNRPDAYTAACIGTVLCIEQENRLAPCSPLMLARWLLMHCSLLLFAALFSIYNSWLQPSLLQCYPRSSCLLERSVDASSSALLPLLYSLIATCLQRHSRWLQSADSRNTMRDAISFSFSLQLHHSSMHSLTAMPPLQPPSFLCVRVGTVLHAFCSFATLQRHTGKRSDFDKQRTSKAERHCCCWLTVVSAAPLSVVLYCSDSDSGNSPQKSLIFATPACDQYSHSRILLSPAA